MTGIPALLAFALLVGIAAAFGAQFEPGPWFDELRKPAWNPPSWVFAPVWTILYLGIAGAGWLVWRRARVAGASLCLWGLQLVANALWSWIFFGLHAPGAALVDIVLLLACIVAFMVVARRHSVAASWLFVPYALWVAFAAALNAAIWRAN